VPTPAANSRSNASVASDGSEFLVSWTDFRGNTVRSIIATRVTRSGRVLDPLGIRIASTTGGIISQSMVWDGAAYLVLWTVGSYGDGNVRYDIHAARIDSDGKIVTQPRILVEHALLTATQALASNGSLSVATYYNDQQPYGVRAVAIDHESNPVHHEALPIESGSAVWGIAATPSRFALTWSESNGSNLPTTTHAIALTSDGHIAGNPVLVGEGNSPAIASDGSRFLIVSVSDDLEARVLDSSLTQIGETTTVRDATTYPNTSILWRAGRFEVNISHYVESEQRVDVFTTELDADGRLIGPLDREKPGVRSATNGSEVLVLFGVANPPSMDQQIFGALYRGNAVTPDAQELLSWSGNEHTNPVVAASAHGHLVAWNEESGVYFTRVDAHGNSLDGRGILLAPEASRVCVAFDGTNYVAAWKEENAIGVRRIAPATGATVAEVRVPATAWYGIGLAASPGATYVVFTNERVYVTRIPHATSTPDPMPLAVSPQDMNVDAPAASWNGSTLLVAWSEIHWAQSDPPYPLDVTTLAARVTADLTLLDPAPLIVGTILGRDWVELGAPAVASNGEDWLVVADYGETIGEKDVYARRVRRDGTLEGTLMTRIIAGAVPAVTWDGTRYAVAAKDGESVRLAEVPASGALAVRRQTIVATNPALSTLSIAPAAEGEAAVAYTKLSFLPQHTGVERTFLRFMDYGTSRGRVVRR